MNIISSYYFLMLVLDLDMYIRALCIRGYRTSRYQGIVKATVSGVFEDLKFKISEGSDQN